MVPGEGRKVKGFSALMRHSMAWPSNTMSFWVKPSGAAGGDADLLAHDVDAGDGFGDRMLHLQAGVHLDEIEAAVFVQEFDGAGAQIAQLVRARVVTMPPISSRSWAFSAGRAGFFPDFLVAALQRAIALAQMHDIAMAVGQDLDFDMARLLEIFLHIDGVVAEGGLGFGARRGQARRTVRPRSAPPSCRGRRRRRWP